MQCKWGLWVIITTTKFTALVTHEFCWEISTRAIILLAEELRAWLGCRAATLQSTVVETRQKRTWQSLNKYVLNFYFKTWMYSERTIDCTWVFMLTTTVFRYGPMFDMLSSTVVVVRISSQEGWWQWPTKIGGGCCPSMGPFISDVDPIYDPSLSPVLSFLVKKGITI